MGVLIAGGMADGGGAHGTLSLLCGSDLLTGELIPRVEERHRSREFVAWLDDVDAHYPSD